MVCSLFLSLLFLVAATRPAAAAASPTNRTVSYWFSVSSADAIPPFLALVSAHPAAISTVILDCGTAIAVNGSLPLPPLSAPCLAAVLGLNQLRIGVELAIGLANCSIAALRTFSTVAPAATGAALAAFARANNITGVSIDAEPQANNCAGSPTGSAADAIVFASGLAALRTPLNAAGVRLTICVADWSPVVGDYAVLAPAVDRLLDMETYTAPSWTTWLGYYHNIVRDDVPRAKVGNDHTGALLALIVAHEYFS